MCDVIITDMTCIILSLHTSYCCSIIYPQKGKVRVKEKIMKIEGPAEHRKTYMLFFN